MSPVTNNQESTLQGKRRRGRPKSASPLSGAERQAAYKRRLADTGLVDVTVSVPVEDQERLHAIAADFRAARGKKLPGES